MSKVLVTGGTGYIGSHTMVDLIQNGHQVISVDNHINSYEIGPLEGIENITGTRPEHYTIDLCDKAPTQRIFLDHPDIDAIIHFAALKAVGESTEKPMLYFDNNMKSLINILALAQEHHVKKFIF